MQTRVRNVVICIVVMLAAIYAHSPAELWWFRTAIEGTGGGDGWLDYGRFAFSVFEFFWGFAIGAVVAAVVRSPRPLLWGLACGVVGALLLLGTTVDHFYPETPLGTIVWAKSAYVMPIVGAVAGAFAIIWLRNQRGKHAA